MNPIRENLLSLIIQRFGFEHPITIQFATFCEQLQENYENEEFLSQLAMLDLLYEV